MRFSLLKTESFRKGIIFSSFFNFISKGLAFFQGLVIAYYFGAQGETDIYFYCFSAITLVALFVNTLDSSVLIPEAMRLKEVEGEQQSMRFLNFFIYIYLSIGVLATIALSISPVGSVSVLSKFNVGELEEAKTIILLSIPLFALTIITNLLANILASYRYFTIPMIVATLNGFFALVSLVIFHEQWGMGSILVGTIASYILNICVLLFIMKKQIGWDFTFRRIKLRALIVRNIVMAQAGNITSTISSYVPVYMMSSFNSGMLTAYTYGQKTSEIPSQVINMQFSAVAGLKFNALFPQKAFAQLNSVFYRSAYVLFAIQIPIAIFMFMYNTEIIEVLFKRGQFESSTAETSAAFLKYLALLLPFLAINSLMARLFMATQKIMESFWYQIVFNVILSGLYFIMVARFGAIGLPYALLTMHVFNTAFCYFLSRWFFKFITYTNVIKAFLTLVLLNAIPAVGLYFLKSYLQIEMALISTIVGGALFVAAVAIIYYFAGTFAVILKKDDDQPVL